MKAMKNGLLQESLADKRATWSQELSSKRENSPWKQSPKRSAEKIKRVNVIKRTSNWWLCFTCKGCNRHFKSRIGLYSHTRRCSVDSSGASSIDRHYWRMQILQCKKSGSNIPLLDNYVYIVSKHSVLYKNVCLAAATFTWFIAAILNLMNTRFNNAYLTLPFMILLNMSFLGGLAFP